MNIQLRDLAKVSNNSILTNSVLHSLNKKLDEKEKHDFLKWLRLVENELENNKRKIKF